MIVIGSIELAFTKASGTFYCANCATQRSFKHKTKRQFLTVYFIPLIPLQSTGEFVQCSTCQKQYDPSALGLTSADVQIAQRQEAFETIRRVMVTIVAADDLVSDEELAAVQSFARQHDQPDVTTEQVLSEAARVRQAQMDTIGYIRHVAQQLTVEDKELLVRHAFLAATAGGDLSPSRQELLRQLPDAVGIPEPRFREIIVQAVEQ